MSLVHRLGERVGNARAYPDHGRLLDTELHGDGIGRLEPDTADVAGQPVRVLRHHLNRISAIGLEDADRTCRAHTVAVKEDHDLAHDFLLRPSGRNPSRTHRTDAIDLSQTIWLGLDHVEHLVTEGTDELPGVDRSDTS